MWIIFCERKARLERAGDLTKLGFSPTQKFWSFSIPRGSSSHYQAKQFNVITQTSLKGMRLGSDRTCLWLGPEDENWSRTFAKLRHPLQKHWYFFEYFKAVRGVGLTATKFPFSVQFDKPTDVNGAISSLRRFRLLCTYWHIQSTIPTYWAPSRTYKGLRRLRNGEKFI